ncbi:MAG: hypothetical protein HC913_19880 [Microscillaceae bacterium]|nr:hypothetical protein [Microscillaceae bacterium]
MEKIYESPDKAVLVLADIDDAYFLVQMVGKIKKSDYRQAFLQVLRRAKQEPRPGILFQIRDMQNNPDPGRQWFTRYFMRRFYKIVGQMQLAVVKPENPIERRSISLLYSLIGALGIAVKVRFFEKVPQAAQWLQETEEVRPFISPQKIIPREELVKELRLGKGSRVKLKIHFSPRGDLDPVSDLPFLPSVRLIKRWFRSWRQP